MVDSLSKLRSIRYRGLKKMNQFIHRRFGRWDYNRTGVDIFEKDWDNLIILDACRVDTFEKYCSISGELTTETSRGSATNEWLRGNMQGRTLHDTVYVTASPVFYQIEDSLEASFHEVYDIWSNEDWHDEYGTVLPELVAEIGEEMADKHPNKRILIHFLQPHLPFIGEFGRETFNVDDFKFWREVVTKQIQTNEADIWKAYEENLIQTLPHVAGVVENLEGKTVISSDHGQIIGKWIYPFLQKEYGHPDGIYIDDLVNVPWLECETETDRKEIISEPPVSERKRTVPEDTVVNRLEELGYAEPPS